MKIKTKITTIRFLFLVIVVLILSGLSYAYFCLRNITWAKSVSISFEDAKTMVKEVIDAYGSKGELIQYESGGRRNQYTTPEDITRYNTIHLPCSGFDFAVYYETFGIMIPTKSKDADTYARKFATIETNDGYGGKTGDESHQDIVYQVTLPTDTEGMSELFNHLVNDDILQVGDAVIWFKDGEDADGHDVIVYNINKNAADSKKVGVYQAGGAFGLASSSSDITERLSNSDVKLKIAYNDGQSGLYDINSNTVSGSLYETSLYDRMIRDKDANYRLTIYRPLAYVAQGKYNKYDSTNEEATLENISEEKVGSSKMRKKFPGIRVEKTMTSNKAAVQNSIVGLSEELTYTVTIKNTSNYAYNGLKIIEEIPTDLVKEENNRQQVIQNIESIAAGETFRFSYNVTVLDSKSLIGEKIIARGNVVDINGGNFEKIATTTIENIIGTNLDSEQKTLVMSTYDSLKNDKSGLDLIDKVYKQAFDYDLNLSNLVIGGFYDPSSRTQVQNEACNPYTLQSKDTAAVEAGYSLIKNYRRYSYSSSGAPGVELDTANSLYGMVLDGYYNGLSYYYVTDYCSSTRISAYQSFEVADPSTLKKTDRKDRVYEETLQIGDILLYSNRPFTDLQDMDYNIGENGVYAFIWDGNNFTGNNSDKVRARNIIYGTNDLTSSYRHNDDYTKNDLQHLFGKDYFVVLRPALKINLPDDTEPDPVDPDDPVDPIDPDDPVDPIDPDDPVDPVDPDGPVDPVDPDDPVDPITPDDPVDPVTPDSDDVKPTDYDDNGNGNKNNSYPIVPDTGGNNGKNDNSKNGFSVIPIVLTIINVIWLIVKRRHNHRKFY